MNRNEKLIAIRPKIILILEENKNTIETFMHHTLRPVLKFQHNILVTSIRQAPHFVHLKLKEGRNKKNRELLKSFLQKNNTLRSLLNGLVIGLFTESEFNCYLENKTALNKRISEMIITRFLSEVQQEEPGTKA